MVLNMNIPMRHNNVEQICERTIFSLSSVANHLSCSRIKSTSIALNVLTSNLMISKAITLLVFAF